jgi:Ca-activated chloride channel homolog
MIGLRWLLIVFAGLGGASASVAQPTFTTRVEGIRLDVLVTDGERPVTGLGPADFEVRDNGVLQPIDLVTVGDVPLGVVLAVDLSRSIVGDRLTNLRRAGRRLLAGLTPVDRAALVTFNHGVVQHTPLTLAVDQVAAALDETAGDGDTALIEAALSALLLADADAGRNLVVMFSDGADTASFIPAQRVVETARRSRPLIYGVAARRDESRFLQDLTRVTGGRLVEIDNTADPGPSFRAILDEVRQRYLVTFTPTGVEPGGWHRLDVRVKRRGVSVHARAGYVSTLR